MSNRTPKPGTKRPPRGWAKQLEEDNRQKANAYRVWLQNTGMQAIEGIAMLHTMARAGNAQAQQVMNTLWMVLRDAGVQMTASAPGPKNGDTTPGQKAELEEELSGGKL
jgi:hypothetical protein